MYEMLFNSSRVGHTKVVASENSLLNILFLKEHPQEFAHLTLPVYFSIVKVSLAKS